MGGFVRSITRRIFKVIAPPAAQAPVAAQAAAIAEPEKKTVDTSMQEKAKLAGSGHGGSTIMSSAKGIDDDANVSKTVLGAGKKKKIKA